VGEVGGQGCRAGGVGTVRAGWRLSQNANLPTPLGGPAGGAERGADVHVDAHQQYKVDDGC